MLTVSWLVLPLCLAFGSRASHAALLTWRVEGTVRDIQSFALQENHPIDDPALTSLGVTRGTPFSAVLVLDPETPNRGRPDSGYYVPGVLSIEFSAAGYHAGGAMEAIGSQVTVQSAFQYLEVIAHGSGLRTLFDSPAFFFQVLADVPGTFATGAIPLDPPPLVNLHPYGPELITGGFGASFAVVANGTSELLQIRGDLQRWVRVPEPSAAALVAGLLAFGALRASRR